MKAPVLSLRKLIFLLVSSVAVLIIIIQFLCISKLFDIFNTQKHTAVSSMVSQTAQIMEANLSTVSAIQSYTSSNADISDFLYHKDDSSGSSMYLKISDETAAINRFFTDRITMILIDNSERTHTFFNNATDLEKKKINKLYEKYKKNGCHAEMSFFTLSTSSDYELYICSIHPVKRDNTENVGTLKIGTSIVINRVNIYKILRDMEYAGKSGIVFFNTQTKTRIPFTKGITAAKSKVSQTRSLGETPWKITGDLVYENQTSAVYSIIIMIIIELFIIIFLICVIQLFILNKYVSGPIHRFIRFFDEYKLHNTNERLSISQLSEFQLLSHHINTMLDKSENTSRKIVYTQQKLYESELCEKEAVLYALQNQINPHFLYNTLECIGGIALSYHADEITEIMDSLSFMMRYSLAKPSETTVEAEIRALEAYFKILKIRFPQQFSYVFEIDDSTWDYTIIRMIFQPIAENSIKHGLIKTESGGVLKIHGYEKDGKLIFEFYDNGEGIPPQKLSEINSRIENCNQNLYTDNSVGIVNIHRRIKLRYGDEYGLKIESREGEYTLVTITFPIQDS